MRIQWLLHQMEAQNNLQEKENRGVRAFLIIPAANR